MSAWTQQKRCATRTAPVLKHKRTVEDELFGGLDVTDVSLSFCDSAHSGDKRKLVQPCILAVSSIHRNHGWAKCKSLLGLLGPVTRARVSELISDDHEKPANPPQRAAQRGVQATKQIIEMLVDGVGFAEGVPMFVVEMLHSKYMEWPKAAWELQNKQLSSAATTSWHFVSYMTDDDADSSVGHKFMASKINSEWWDKCSEAGPATRPQSGSPEKVPDLTLAVIANGKVKLPDAVIESIGSNGADLQKTIQEFNESALISFLAPE
ncbi:Uncharacterized protein SCF082_LOCUS10633 [Durusdinium trenchii]|uniref:Uncharacterized protein n=1 Tax=Durusdinium trenchii TaxID=1381693 RepID=A0ABP0J7K8_9DINO